MRLSAAWCGRLGDHPSVPADPGYEPSGPVASSSAGEVLRAVKMNTEVCKPLLSVALGALLSLPGCSSHDPPSPAINIAVADIQAVVGEWEGSVQTTPDRRLKASIFLIINENGAYNFVAEDAAAIGLGAGILTVENGILVSSSQGRQVRMALYDRNGQQTLVGAVRNAKGEDFLVGVIRRNTSSR